jgi:hypothetical protein
MMCISWNNNKVFLQLDNLICTGGPTECNSSQQKENGGCVSPYPYPLRSAALYTEVGLDTLIAG